MDFLLEPGVFLQRLRITLARHDILLQM